MLWGMISSRVRAPRFGPGRLIVDGADTVLSRKATFAFRPSRRREGSLLALLRACCEVYNAGLQERRDAWAASHAQVTVFDQFKQVTGLRGVRDDVLGWGIQPVRGALRRLDGAFAGFYRRVAAGQTPGFPRFRSHRRFDTVSWDEPSSWRVNIDGHWLRIHGVGEIRLPKSPRRQLARLADRGGVPRTLTVTRCRAGGTTERPRWVWRATVGFTQVTPITTTPTLGPGSVIGADRGVVVTLATSDGRLEQMPDWMGTARERIVVLQQAQARKTKYSRAWRQLNRQIGREHRKTSRRVDNWARTTARELVARAEVIALEDLNLPGMTRSAKGTIENPGSNVAAKSGLNRALHDAALGRLARWVGVKAEEAGHRTWLVNPAHTSQQCNPCGHTAKDNRPDRDTFICTRCGHKAHADINAAQNIATRAMVCEAAWHDAGRPPLHRPTPRLRRRTRSAVPSGSETTKHDRGRAGSGATTHGGQTQK